MKSLFYILVMLFICVGFINQYIQMHIIVPFVIKHRGQKFWDNIAGTHQYKRLLEYKKIREETNQSIFWYKIQILLTIIIIGLVFICFLMVGYFTSLPGGFEAQFE